MLPARSTAAPLAGTAGRPAVVQSAGADDAPPQTMAWHRFALADLAPMPWKNGAGSTREIVCRPPGSGIEHFDWRVSIASITESGPFSVFAGVDRVIMLLEGDGVRLHSGNGLRHTLDRPGEPFAFSGDEALECTLLGGPSVDFNVMTRRSTVRAELTLLRAPAVLESALRGLLFTLRGNWRLNTGGTALSCAAGHGLWWDAIPLGWEVAPQCEDAALLWLRLEPAGV